MADLTNLFSRKVVVEKNGILVHRCLLEFNLFIGDPELNIKSLLRKLVAAVAAAWEKKKLVKTWTKLLGKLGEFKQRTLGDREMQQTQGMLAVPIPVTQRIYSLEINDSKKICCSEWIGSSTDEFPGWCCNKKALMKSLYKQRQCEQEQKCDFYLLQSTLIGKLLHSNRWFTMGCSKAHSIYLIRGKKRGASGWRGR